MRTTTTVVDSKYAEAVEIAKLLGDDEIRAESEIRDDGGNVDDVDRVDASAAHADAVGKRLLEISRTVGLSEEETGRAEYEFLRVSLNLPPPTPGAGAGVGEGGGGGGGAEKGPVRASPSPWRHRQARPPILSPLPLLLPLLLPLRG